MIIEKESDEDFESEHKYRIVNDGEFLLNMHPNCIPEMCLINSRMNGAKLIDTKLKRMDVMLNFSST